jgi:hypothetical protein
MKWQWLWMCVRERAMVYVDVERTLAITILAGKSDSPPEHRGFSDRAHVSVVLILACAHISVLRLYRDEIDTCLNSSLVKNIVEYRQDLGKIWREHPTYPLWYEHIALLRRYTPMYRS